MKIYFETFFFFILFCLLTVDDFIEKTKVTNEFRLRFSLLFNKVTIALQQKQAAKVFFLEKWKNASEEKNMSSHKRTNSKVKFLIGKSASTDSLNSINGVLIDGSNGVGNGIKNGVGKGSEESNEEFSSNEHSPDSKKRYIQIKM